MWVFLVLMLMSDGKIQREWSRPYPNFADCETARAQVVRAYEQPDGSNIRPEGTGVITRKCERRK